MIGSAGARMSKPRITHAISEQPLLIPRKIINDTLPKQVMVFASGMNRLADLNAAIAAGVPVGVDVSRISNRVIEKIAESDVPVLLDSGAFAEVVIRNGCVEVTRAINDREWKRRLNVYLRITEALCAKKVSVIAVAPDRVGSQEITLERLSRFRKEIRQLRSAGAMILVPLQCGKLSFAEFFAKAKGALDLDLLPGIPMNKAAASASAIMDFVRNTAIARIHFLGMGAANPTARPLARLLQQMCPNIQVSMDANSIRAAVGMRRAVTVNEAVYADEMSSSWSGEVDLRQWGGDVYDLTELLYQPSSWLSSDGLKRLANSFTWITQRQRDEFAADPDSFVNAERNQNGWLDEALMQAYFGQLQRKCRQGARTRAVFEHLERSQIAHQV